MKKDILFLRNESDKVVKEKKDMEQITIDRERELTEDLKALEYKMPLMKGRILDKNEKGG
jgi:hypothetical protein